MKIAIQGHPTRGKEVIQILESLGGKNTVGLEGTYDTFYYIDNKNKIGDDHKKNFPPTYKLYTLEEFEKEFPFKIGDVVFHKGHKAIVEMFVPRENCYYIRYNNPPIDGIYYTKWTTAIELKMKEERNITLTLDKAKEWYKKGGELKEIALQAFTEKELNPLPRSWEEFCEKYPIKRGECILESRDTIRVIPCDCNGNRVYKNWIPSKESAEAHLAMIQLEQLRNCWWNGWEPDWNNGQQTKYCIIHSQEFKIQILYVTRRFLSFPTIEMAEEFLKCFKDLIEQAGDLL